MRSLQLLSVATALLVVSCSQKKSAVTTAETPQATPSLAAKAGWLTSYDQAQKEAQSKHKLLLMDFTGSDWCGWCIMLDKEVFSKPEFKEYASKNLVLLELDFSAHEKNAARNGGPERTLAMKYGIQGFPTVVVFDSDGKPLGALGYEQGGPQVFIAQLEKLRKG